MIESNVSGTLEDYKIVFRYDGKLTSIELDNLNMKKSRNLLNRQPISVTFDLLRSVEEDIKETVSAFFTVKFNFNAEK